MSDKPTGVFVRFDNGELSDQQTKDMRIAAEGAKNKGDTYTQAVTAGIIATGTSVTGGDLYPVGYINEDAIGGLATGIYSSASIFREKDVEHYGTVSLVRQSDAQAQIAALEAEVVRLREENERLHRIAHSGTGSVTQVIHSPTRFMKPDLKGGAA